jgi:hypothetical protein
MASLPLYVLKRFLFLLPTAGIEKFFDDFFIAVDATSASLPETRCYEAFRQNRFLR